MMEKIGEVNYMEFKTEFSLTPKVKEYLENESVSTASLLPNGWEWYEAELFGVLDDEKKDEKYGKEFEVIYYGIVEARDLSDNDWDNEEKAIKEKGFADKIEEGENFIYDSTTGIASTPKNPNKSFDVKYMVRKK